MTIRRASLILPCRRLDDFPTHVPGQGAAELLAAWTGLWHPSLIRVTGGLPGWHPADEPPDPASLEGELVIIPSVSRQRLAGDWCDGLRATAPQNPPPIDACASRGQSVAAMLAAAGLPANQVSPETAADFLALGYAHLQVELLTRAMHYTSVLDVEQFTGAVVAAANAAVGNDEHKVHDELSRAFDLLADARNHVYAVDFYVVDMTLLAQSTLGDSLRRKLAARTPTNVLLSGELLERLAVDHSSSVAELRSAMAAGTAAVTGGRFEFDSDRWRSPEALLTEVARFQEKCRGVLGRQAEIFGQFNSTFSPLLPEIIGGMGFEAALHAAFDGGRLPRAEQCKTRWGPSDGAWIEALSITPLDASKPETWLAFAERVGDTIAHDHVATLLLAGWPGQESEYVNDLHRASRFNSVLGKLVTLEEYFQISRETDDWSSFSPTEYRGNVSNEGASNPISSQVRAYRQDVLEVHSRLCDGLRSIASLASENDGMSEPGHWVVLNPWNFACSRFAGVDPLNFSRARADERLAAPVVLPDVPGCGFALLESPGAAGGASLPSDVPLADGHTLRNERLEVTIGARTGGIQSLRKHADRSTRVSQRLVFHDESLRRQHGRDSVGNSPKADNRMIADSVEVTRNDAVLGEITSRGRLLDAADGLLARFTQTARIARGLPAVLVDVQLEPERAIAGAMWRNYLGTRLAWPDEAATLRRGAQWLARDVTEERIESPEWIEISADTGNIVCVGLGLPFHRHAGPTWLDTLLITASEEERRFQFAIGLDCSYPTQLALALVTAGVPIAAELPFLPAQSRGWFVHIGARNVVMTHLAALGSERAGFRCRVLETEGRNVEAKVSAFRPLHAARFTNFRGETSELLSVVDGAAQFHIGPHGWRQIEAEW